MLQDFAQAVIFHSSDRDPTPAATAQRQSSSAGAAGAPAPASFDVQHFLSAIAVLKDIRDVAAQLLSEVHLVVLDDSQPLPVRDVDGNLAKLEEFKQLLERQRALLKVRLCLYFHC